MAFCYSRMVYIQVHGCITCHAVVRHFSQVKGCGCHTICLGHCTGTGSLGGTGGSVDSPDKNIEKVGVEVGHCQHHQDPVHWTAPPASVVFPILLEGRDGLQGQKMLTITRKKKSSCKNCNFAKLAFRLRNWGTFYFVQQLQKRCLPGQVYCW